MKCFLYVNSVSGLCLRLRDTALEFNLSFGMCRWLVEGLGRRGRPRGIVQAPSAFDQQTFAKVVGIEVATIAHACSIVSQGGSNDL